jgi:alcohol dehydrogenase (NADP+)
MAHNGTTFTLNTGAKIPAIGFGTWQDKESQEPYVGCNKRQRQLG